MDAQVGARVLSIEPVTNPSFSLPIAAPVGRRIHPPARPHERVPTTRCCTPLVRTSPRSFSSMALPGLAVPAFALPPLDVCKVPRSRRLIQIAFTSFVNRRHGLASLASPIFTVRRYPVHHPTATCQTHMNPTNKQSYSHAISPRNPRAFNRIRKTWRYKQEYQ